MLNPKDKYLQIAFNRSLPEVKTMIDLLPSSERIIIEAGTPLIKQYGQFGIAALKKWWIAKVGKSGYLVADLKCLDRGASEVEAARAAGANAATVLGLAPVETINAFIKECARAGLDAMVDMMNVRFPFEILGQLAVLQAVVILHLGADEREASRSKRLPHEQIHRLKGTYDRMLISVAGNETEREVRRAFFNDADIAVVWRSFYDTPDKTADLARAFLEQI